MTATVVEDDQLSADVRERLRLGEAARAALAEAEGRWRRELGAAAQERMRLRADIAALTQRRSKPLVHSPPGRSDGDAHAAKRARVDAGPPIGGSGEAGTALSRTELYAMYHGAEETLRVERERANDAEAQLARLLAELDTQLPIYKERSERLKAALQANTSLSERLASAHKETERLTGETGRLELEVHAHPHPTPGPSAMPPACRPLAPGPPSPCTFGNHTAATHRQCSGEPRRPRWRAIAHLALSLVRAPRRSKCCVGCPTSSAPRARCRVAWPSCKRSY